MAVQQDLLNLSDLFNFSDISSLTQNIPIKWVESALRLSASTTIRRRRLPSEQVLWLMLGMAMFRNEPVHEVARRLNICAQDLASDSLLAQSGVTNARKRLGSDPVEGLFRQTGTHWGNERYPEDEWNGLKVMAASNPISGMGRRLSELRSGIGSLFLERRPRPAKPRTVKISKTRYPVDRYAAPLK